MEGIKTFFESFKEFIWDIIGYLFPGLYTLIILSICINPQYFPKSQYTVFSGDNALLITLFVAYILGYVIYGFGELKEKLLGKFSYTKKKEREISKGSTYLQVKKIITNRLKSTSEPIVNINSVRELRNIVMSTIPESDQKIYTFMFRSEISKHIANVSLVVGATGIFFSITNIFNTVCFFKTSESLIAFYIFLAISYVFLRETRNRFYVIALSVPFSIYLSKQTTNEQT